MYVPPKFQNKDTSSILEFIRQHSFGILVSQGADRIMATHIPLELSKDEAKLTGHVSRANPQWKNFKSGDEVLAIFSGPHAYISSSWYNHENVPTWNYLAVHVYGTIKIIEGEKLYDSLRQLIATHEAASTHPVSIDTMSPDYVRKSIQGIVGFEIDITKIEAAQKLSQNRDRENHERIMAALDKRHDNGAKEISAAMKKINTLISIT